MSYQLQSNALPTKVLYIDSRDASRYLQTQLSSDGEETDISLTSYFQYILNESIEIPSNQRCLISLESATIPYSFYTIRKFVNDKIPLKMVDDDAGNIGYATFLITPANYTIYTLATYLETNLPAVVGDTNWNNFYASKWTIDITFSQDTGKLTFTMTPSVSTKNWSLYLDFSSEDQTEIDKYANVETGFNLGSKRIQYEDGADPVHSLESENVCDISGSIHGVYVRTNLVSNGTLDSQTGTFSNILSRLPINVASGGIIFASPSNNQSRSLVDLRSVNSLTIRLTDERNRVVDLNGLHFQVAILLEFVYAEKPILSRQGGLIKDGGMSFGTGTDMKQKILNYQKQRELLEEQERTASRRGPGRPRNVGRPRGSGTRRPVGRPRGS